MGDPKCVFKDTVCTRSKACVENPNNFIRMQGWSTNMSYILFNLNIGEVIYRHQLQIVMQFWLYYYSGQKNVGRKQECERPFGLCPNTCVLAHFDWS